MSNCTWHAVLYLQFIVDAYSKVESKRMNYHSNILRPQRTDQYQQIVDRMRNEDLIIDNVGQLIILSPSYTGGPRYMFEKHTTANLVHGHSQARQTTGVRRCSKGFPKAYAEETRLDSRDIFPSSVDGRFTRVAAFVRG